MPQFVGREREVALLDAARLSLPAREARVVTIVGEPGIGKTTLLRRLSSAHDEPAPLVLVGRADEFEREIPLGVFVDALDAHLATLPPDRLVRLGTAHLAELAAVFPALTTFGDGGPDGLPERERYRLHRAVRSLLERLSVGPGLTLVLDDLHWADPASVELLASLVRRPLDGAILIAVAHRPHEVDPALRNALSDAAAQDRVTAIALGPLTRQESDDLLPAELPLAARRTLYDDSGGNPFYLEQLARQQEAGPAEPAGPAARPGPPRGDGVPPAVAAALAAELSPLSQAATLLLQGGAVLGEPFDAGVAGELAELPEAATWSALDEALAANLLQPTDAPRRFRFRHPLVRRAVWEATPAGWRFAAHGRAAATLAAAGAGPARQAHHVAQSARPGDDAAIALLLQAGVETAPRAPSTAVRWYEAALRLAPDRETASARYPALLPNLAGALAASGRFEESHAVLLDVLVSLPDGHPAQVDLIAACAAVDRHLGRHQLGLDRLRATLVHIDDPHSATAAALHLELAAHASLTADFPLMRESAERARTDAERLGEHGLEAAALAALAFADYSVGDIERAGVRCTQAAAYVDGLDDDALRGRIETFLFLGWAEWFMGRGEQSGRHFTRGLGISRATGRSALVIELMMGQTLALSAAGRIAEAVDVADAATEEARMIGNAHTLEWALFALTIALEPAEEIGAAVRAGKEAVTVALGTGPSTIAAGCGWALASALVEAGDGDGAIAVMLELLGGEDLPYFFPGHQATCYEVLTRAELLGGRIDAAERWAARAHDAAERCGLPFAAAVALRAGAEIRLAKGDAAGAATSALAAAEGSAAAGAPVEAARAQLLAGRALAAAGDRDGAATILRTAESALLACGAERLRAVAVRELRQIGRRVSRRGRQGAAGLRAAEGPDSLSGREREIALLAAAGDTNRDIASALFLSEKTVESHLASVFVKLGVASRGAIEAALAQPA